MRWIFRSLHGKRNRIHRALADLARRHRPFTFLQVGSSDGVLNDPLRDFIKSGKAVGAFIEPIPEVFCRLKSLYAGVHDMQFLNCAVDVSEGVRTLYVIDDPRKELPDWAYQVASFHKDVLLNHAHSIPDVAQRIKAISVSCRTLESVISVACLGRLDCLQIDTEGHDYEVLKAFPFHRLKPGVLIYEHKHLSSDDYDAAVSLAVRNGYQVLQTGGDILGVQ